MKFSEDNLLLQYPFQDQHRVLVDVGAHEGFFTRVFAEQGWKVIAFEPEIENRKVFINKFKDMPNVTCIPKAVTDKSGEVIPFYTSKKHYGIHSLKPFHSTHERSDYDVETITVTDALYDIGIEKITVLKIDIEGADFLALKGTDFKKFQPELVMVEFMDERTQKNFDYNHHDVVKYMQGYEYTAYISEWAQIKEYGVKGEKGCPHTWIRCEKYPLDNEPAWGNIIFLAQKNSEKFEQAIREYCRKEDNWMMGLFQNFMKIITNSEK